MLSIRLVVLNPGFHLRYFFALEKLPFKKSTSVGLKNFLSISIIIFLVFKLIAFSLSPLPIHFIRRSSFLATILIKFDFVEKKDSFGVSFNRIPVISCGIK